MPAVQFQAMFISKQPLFVEAYGCIDALEIVEAVPRIIVRVEKPCIC